MAEPVAGVRLEGVDTLALRLSFLQENMRRKIIRGGLRAAGRQFILRARQLVPVSRPGTQKRQVVPGQRAGDLRRSIRFSQPREARIDARIYAEVKAGGRKAFYAHMVEGGTRPHEIRPRKAKALAIGGRLVAGAVQHPGTRAQRFMARAAQQADRAASQAFAEYVRLRLQLVMAGQARS